MTIELSPEGWAQLRSERPLSEGSLATYPVVWADQETAILIGMDATGELQLLIPVPDTEVRRGIPDLNGLRVRLTVTENGPFLGLAASPRHERVFTPFCREIVQAVFADAREPWAAIDSIIRNWQAIWRPSRLHMTHAVQIGLVGELLVLTKVLLPVLGTYAVACWSGADKERHDFVAGTLHLEVKTTTRGRHEHEISRLDQLWIADGRSLILASIRLEQSIGGSITVATLVDELIDLLRHDAWAVDGLLIKLAKLGWVDEMRRSGELNSFNLSDATFYPVEGNFPRLPESFCWPSGVVAVKYTIDLANLPTLDTKEVAGLLEAAATPASAG